MSVDKRRAAPKAGRRTTMSIGLWVTGKTIALAVRGIGFAIGVTLRLSIDVVRVIGTNSLSRPGNAPTSSERAPSGT
jgi:hypothetical protein